MASVTGLRATGSGRVAVEVDGSRWRTLPPDVVAKAGLKVGVVLERPLLRELRRELRRQRALAAATRALRASSLSERALDERLRRAHFNARERREALEIVRGAGFVDDERFAHARAEALAARHAGDALIRHDLRVRGVDDETVERALAALDPEPARASRAAASRRRSAAAGRYLARRGFGEDAIEHALGLVADGP